MLKKGQIKFSKKAFHIAKQVFTNKESEGIFICNKQR
jgi:ribose 5-phosphate isomerase RpiB